MALRTLTLFNRSLNNAMAIGVRVEPELERRLDQLAISRRRSASKPAPPTGVNRCPTGLTGRHDDQRLAAVVVQANRWLQDHPSVTLCPLTSTLIEAPLVRLSVQPTPSNGLRKPSQLMIDKLFTVPMAAIGAVIGVLEPAAMANLDLALRGWLELG